METEILNSVSTYFILSCHTLKNMGEIGRNTFGWSFDRFLERKGEKKISSTFQIWGDDCFLLINPRDGKCCICSMYSPLYLVIDSNCTRRDGRSIKICLIGRNGKEVFAVNRTLHQVVPFNEYLLMTFDNEELCENAKDLLPGGTLTVRLSWYEERDEKRPMEMLETLSRDWFRFHVSNANTDCTLRLGNTELQAHRAVLSARSEVFAAMFRQETAENRNGVVDILDVETDVMRDCLNYMYAGTVQRLTTSNAAPLFIVAEKYHLTLLQEACLSFLTDNLTVGNVCDAAVLADTYGEEKLEKKVVQFIGDRMADIQGSAEWKKFLHNEQPLSMKLLFSLTALKDVKK